MVPLSFAGEEWLLTRSGALFWPRESALLVADLHLEKGSFFASRGQMIPPYDSRETLGRLAGAIRDTGARRVFALGGNFHDAGGRAAPCWTNLSAAWSCCAMKLARAS